MKNSFKILQILFSLVLVALIGSAMVDVVHAMPDLSVQSFIDSLQYALPHAPGVSMAYVLASVPKTGSNPGRPRGKNSKIVIFKWDDVDTMPERDANGIKIANDLVLNAGAQAMYIYATPSTIAITQTNEGDPDAKGFIQQIVFEHPGDEISLEEFLENNVNENLGCIVKESGNDTYRKLLGTPYEPLQFDVEAQDDNEARKNTITLKSVMRGPRIAHYFGALPTVDGSGSGAGI